MTTNDLVSPIEAIAAGSGVSISATTAGDDVTTDGIDVDLEMTTNGRAAAVELTYGKLASKCKSAIKMNFVIDK